MVPWRLLRLGTILIRGVAAPGFRQAGKPGSAAPSGGLFSLSGQTYNAWNPIKSDINEFCRRYAKFCEFFRGVPGALFLRYEDFVSRPDGVLQQMCKKLAVTFNPFYLRDLNQFKLSGASGRTSYEQIAPRPRRPMGEAERAAFLNAEHFAKACELGGYSAAL